MPISHTFPVVILGGGLAGLIAGAHLAERGIAPLVLEADSQYAGGRLQGGPPETFSQAGREWSFPTEHGMHALWGGYDNLRAALERFAPVRLLPSAGEDWLYRRAREVRRAEAGSAVRRTWLPAPLHYLQLLLLPRFWAGISLLDFAAAPGFLVSLLMALGVDPLLEEIRWDGLSLDEFFRGWTPNLKVTFVGLARNLLAQPAETISLTAFIAALRFYTVLRRDAWTVEFLPDTPQRCLVEPLVARIEAGGGSVRLGARAVRLERASAGWRVAVEDARRGGRSVAAERVILALDPPGAEKLLTSSPDTAAAARALRFPNGLPCAAIRLWFDRPPERQWMPGGMLTGDFALDNFFWLERLRPDFTEWAVATGGSCLEMHLYASAEGLAKADKALIAQAVGEAARAWPELKGHLVHGSIRRNEASQPQFVIPTHADSLWVETPWEGISACGDWIGCPSPALNMERSAISAILAANAVIAAHGGEPYTIIASRRPEPLAWALGGMVRTVRKVIGPVVWRLARRRDRDRDGMNAS
jgi:carotenoid phi-ring synthase / carotenoid chi-ring synthase